jgi:hypothetical protein
VLVPDARALHFHGATLGAASPTQRRLEAFGRGYTLAKYGVVHGPRRLVAAVLDWPVLLTHLLVRRELGPIRERRRGLREGRRARRLRAPVELATIGFGEAVARQLRVLKLRASGRLPEYLDDAGPAR